MLKSKGNEEYVKWWEHWMSQIQRRVIVQHSSSDAASVGRTSKPTARLPSQSEARNDMKQSADEPDGHGLGLGS